MSVDVTPPTLTLRHPELGTAPVPTDIYWRPEFYERELATIFRGAWLCMGRIEHVEMPGQFFTREIPTFGMSIIIARRRDGTIRAFHNVCQHRGHWVEVEKAGRRSVFRCSFHGWCYDLEGKLAAVPDEEAFYDLDRSKKGLIPVHLDVWEGFIFINLAETPPMSLSEFLGDHGRDLAGYPYERNSETFHYEGVINANWKCVVDSFSESYHLPVLHRRSIADTLATPANPFGRLIEVSLKGPHRSISLWGNKEFQPPPVQGLGYAYAAGPAITSGQMDETLVLPPGLNPTRAPHWSLDVTMFFPNWLLVLGTGMSFAHQIWPLGPSKTLYQVRGYLAPARTAAERFSQEVAMVNLRDTLLEDGNTLERSQRALNQGLLKEFTFHDHELALRHHYHAVVNWVERMEREKGLIGGTGQQ